MNISEEIFRAVIWTSVGLFGAAISAIFMGSIKIWLDVRSLKKSANASFAKIRRLEHHVFGAETCEGDKK